MRPSRLTPRRLVSVFLLLSGCLLLSMALALAMGSVRVPFGTILHALSGAAGPQEASIILLQVRLPRILLAALTGAALASAGAAFQAVLRNPLADPYILGISGGAALGAILSTLSGADSPFGSLLARPLFAFAGACCSASARVQVSSRQGVVGSAAIPPSRPLSGRLTRNI